MNTQPLNKKAVKRLPAVLKTHFEYLDSKAMVDDAMDVSVHAPLDHVIPYVYTLIIRVPVGYFCNLNDLYNSHCRTLICLD